MQRLRLAGLLVLFAGSAAAQDDPARGRLLYETHCGACHYERVHQRMRTKIRDLPDLRDEVGRWSAQTKRTWTLDELEDVVQYLNASHYRLGLPPKEGKK
jgi:mono/diheme cytochrome c family protein